MRSVLRKHRLLLISGILGISAAAISHAAISPYIVTSPVVVAAREIEQYEKIEPADLTVVSYPQKAVPKGHFADAGLLRGGYALSRILVGQVVLKGHVARGEDEVGLSAELEPDTRCVFLPAGYERAVGGLIKPGERVDAVFTPRSGAYASALGGEAVLVVRSLLVVEVCREPSSGQFAGVVVLAERTEAERMASSLESCAVNLLLSPKEDRSLETTPGTEAWVPW